MNVKVLLRKTKPENTEGFVWLCFYVRSKKTHFTTGVKVNEKDWSEKQLRVLKTDPQYKEKNLIIDSKVSRVTQVFVKFQLEDKKPNRESFMRAYRRPSDFATFTEFARHIQEKEAKKTSPNTRHVEDVVLKKLDEKFPKLTIDEFTSEILDDFFGYLLKDRQNNQNTAYKNIMLGAAGEVVIRGGAFAGCTVGQDELNVALLTGGRGRTAAEQLKEQQVQLRGRRDLAGRAHGPRVLEAHVLRQVLPYLETKGKHSASYS